MKSDILFKIDLIMQDIIAIENSDRYRKIEEKIEFIGKKILNPNFWEEEDDPSSLQQEHNKLLYLKNNLSSIKENIQYIEDLAELDGDEEFEAKQKEERVNLLENELENLKMEIFLDGKYDICFALVSLQSGAGGKDAEDWTAMLLRMYQRFFEYKNWPYEIISQQFSEGGGPEGRIGLKEGSLRVKVKFAYGFLKNENGIHRLVRVSPFSAKKLRHTSFAKVEVLPFFNISQGEPIIKEDELKIDYFRSSGPGGQNVNKRETAVRVTHIPSGLSAASQVERTQFANKKIALEVLYAKILNQREEERMKELNKIKGNKIEASFGSQKRSYVLYPYKLVKDHKTGFETSDTDAVLNGELTGFIKSGMML